MENRTYAAVLGDRSAAPRLASYGGKCGVAINYVAITHPSLPNYLAAVSGSTGGVTSDCGPASCPQNRPSLFGQLSAAGLEWRGYAESMPGTCVLGSTDGYATKHNPAVYFTPIRSQCRSWDVPMGTRSDGAFASALRAQSLPAFSFVTPNICNDGHDCSISHADKWLSGWLDTIVTSPAYKTADTAVFVTWDEGVGANQHIATVVVAPTVPKGTRVATRFDHYSLLSTTEELLGLPLLGAAQAAPSLRAAFGL